MSKKSERIPCPDCSELIMAEDEVCPHCGWRALARINMKQAVDKRKAPKRSRSSSSHGSLRAAKRNPRAAREQNQAGLIIGGLVAVLGLAVVGFFFLNRPMSTQKDLEDSRGVPSQAGPRIVPTGPSRQPDSEPELPQNLRELMSPKTAESVDTREARLLDAYAETLWAPLREWVRGQRAVGRAESEIEDAFAIAAARVSRMTVHAKRILNYALENGAEFVPDGDLLVYLIHEADITFEFNDMDWRMRWDEYIVIYKGRR